MPGWVKSLHESLKAGGNTQQLQLLELQFPALAAPAPAMQDTSKLWAAANRRLEVAHKHHDEALTKLLKLEDMLSQQRQKLVDAALELASAKEAQAKAQALAQEVPTAPAVSVETLRAALQEGEKAQALELEQSIKHQQEQLQQLLVAAQQRESQKKAGEAPMPMETGEEAQAQLQPTAAPAAGAKAKNPGAEGKVPTDKAKEKEAETLARKVALQLWAEQEAKKQRVHKEEAAGNQQRG